MNRLEIAQEVYGDVNNIAPDDLLKIARVIELAQQVEREACAKVCDERAIGWKDANCPRNDTYAAMHTAAKNEARALAEAIRARG